MSLTPRAVAPRTDASRAGAALRALPLAVVLGLVLAPGVAATHPPSAVDEMAPAIDGAVRHGERPIAAARVYAYEVASFALQQVMTDGKGRFRFDALPAGLYKIVAHKDGFLPVVHLLMRRTADDRQRLELRLVEDRPGEVRDGEAYWEARGRVPADVLREIHRLGDDLQHEARLAASDLQMPASFRATMAAQGGVESLGAGQGNAQRTGARVGFEGDVGSLAVDFDGRFEQLVPREGVGIGDGEVRAMELSLYQAERTSLQVQTATAQLPSLAAPSQGRDVDLERYQVAWELASGDVARTSVTARFTEQSNFFRAGWVDPSTIPMSSRTWEVEGAYQRAIGRSNLRTGLSYHQIDGETPYAYGDPDWLDQERLGVYGLADTRLGNRVLVEYGLFSTLHDGGMSLMPHGGVIVELGDGWEARGTMARRVETESEPLFNGFTTALYGEGDTCRRVGEVCYEVALTRGRDADDSVTIAAVHREIAETLRLYFSEDFFDRLESLFLVRGDELPEVQLGMARRISPRILAKLESNYAEGGGGIFYATDAQAYENRVRYLVTSLDTQLEASATGIFVAFHHLEQALDPVLAQGSGSRGSDLEIERLQVMLTQDLGLLMDVSSSWAVRFNMELSRGATPYRLRADDELYKKLTGGFTVSF